MENDKKVATSHYSKKRMSKAELARKGGFWTVASLNEYREPPAEYGKHPYKLDIHNK